MTETGETSRGTWYAIWAYAMWGLLPVFWKQLQHVPSSQLLCHRVVWSFFCLLAITWYLGRGATRGSPALDRKTVRIYICASLLIGINWSLFIWAVNAGFLVEISLGYFLSPLLSVALGVIFFREGLRLPQWVAIGLAGLGLLYMTILYRSLPWISLTLATSFALYGMVKKKAPLESIPGLGLETAILFFPALAWLLAAEMRGHGAFLHSGTATDLMLITAGPMTTLPLLLFTSAVRRVPLSVVGMTQYVSPTLQFLLGVLVYNEPFTRARLIGFAMVWLALLVFAADGIIRRGRQAYGIKSSRA